MRRRIQSLYQDHSSERNHQECLQCSLEELASLRNLSKGAIAIKEHTRRWSGLNRPLKIRAMLVDSDLNPSVVINALQPVGNVSRSDLREEGSSLLGTKVGRALHSSVHAR